MEQLLLQLVVMAGKRAFHRRALRRPHPARREVTCGDNDMDWPRLGAVLHTTGLWGRSYLGVGRRAASRTWQKLCHREDTGLPWGKPYRGRIHIWDYPKGNQAIRTPSPVQGLTGDPGELTPVLGLTSDCSAQSDCRGCLEDSTRVHRPGNWTGGEKGARIPGWGGMAQQAWHRPVLLAHYMPQGAWLALRLVRQGDGLHYPVGQPLFGDSLPFLLPSVADKELLGASDAPGAGHVYAQCSYGTQQR